MELLLSLGTPAPGAARPRRDVSVELDAFTPIAQLRDALVAWMFAQGDAVPPDPVLVAIHDGRARGLAPDVSVFDARLLSGYEVDVVTRAEVHRMGAGSADAPPAHPGVSLDVTSGPAAGRTVTFGPGRHVVGRAPECDVTLDDASMSRQHFGIEVTVPPGGGPLLVQVDPNPEATNGTFLDARRLEEPTPWQIEEALFAGSSQMVLRGARFDTVGHRDRLGQVSFNRLPYRRPVVRSRALTPLAAPPERPGKRRFPLVTLLLPIVGAVAITVLTKQYEFLLLAGLSPLMMVSNHVSEGRSSRGSYSRDKAEFDEKVGARLVEVNEALSGERSERMLAAPDVPLLNRQAAGRLGRLWERPRASADFLDLRVGLGTTATRVTTPVNDGGDPELRSTAEAALSVSQSLSLVPATVNLDEARVTGLWGTAEAVAGLGAALVTQAATLHSPEDLVIAAAIPTSQIATWGWLKWLPQTRSVTSPLEGAQLVDERGGDDLLRRLLDVVAVRANHDQLAGAPWPRVLFVCHEGAHVNRATLATLLDVAGAAGVVTLWIGEDHSQLPRQCRATLRCSPPLQHASLLRYTDPERDDVGFDLEGINPLTATTIARTLAPVRDVSAASATTGIPRVVNLFDLPGLPPCQPEVLAQQWAKPHPYGLLCELGIGPEGSFVLDLVAEGPHALVAGTSGAGKSELLQSLVLTLAARYSPDRLNFLFIDYKGGAGSAELGPLPHTVGSVTNLDERLALRALASLRAELRRRMAVLDGRAKDLADMLKVAPAEAPPSLVIVVDEFATLVKEIPDFVAGIVDIAQRGRSLGIHLVLATQRPTGAVNDNILANTNLRIALRVLDVGDSKAVIDAGDAAGIPVPLRGRAFARTGPGALQPFQCAWSGAPNRPEEQATPVLIHPYPFSAGALSGGLPSAPAPAAEEMAHETQLSALVRACREAATLARLDPPRRPWVEPLPERVSLDDLLALDTATASRVADPGRTVLLGLGDLPEEQRQTVVDVDLEASGGLLIFGSGGAGKTTLLRTIAAGLARQGTPDEVQLFVFDFAGRSLAQLEELPHVAATATSDDLEKVTRMLTVLEREIERRRRILADARAESVSALRATSRARPVPSLPRIVVLMDNYATFHATFEGGLLYRWVTSFQQLVTDGRQVGVHVVITNSRQLGIPLALSSAVAARVVMRMANPDELVGLGVTRKAASGSDLGDGRCFIPSAFEVQAATVSEDPLGSAQASAISALADKLRAEGMTKADALKELPSVVTLDLDDVAPPVPGGLRVGLGLADLTLATVTVDLGRQNFVVLGPPLSGRSSALAAVATALAGGPAAPQLIGLGGLTSPLAQLDCWDVAGFGRSKHLSALAAAAATVEGDEGDEVKLVVVIDSAEDFESMEYGMTLEPLVRSDAVRVVATAEVSTLERAYSGWMAELKRNRAVLMLQPESAGDVESVTRARPALRPGQPFPPGRGVLVDHGTAVLVQVRWAGPAPEPTSRARRPEATSRALG